MIKLARKLEILAKLESWNDKLETDPQARSCKLEVADQLEPQAGNCI